MQYRFFLVGLLWMAFLCPTLFARPLVVSTDLLLSQIVSEIGGKEIDSRALLNRTEELHEVTMTPYMGRLLMQADVVFVYGMGLDFWIKPRAIQPRYFVPVSSGVFLMPQDLHSHLHSHSHHSDVGMNPHYIYDLDNVCVVSATVCKTLSQLDPAHADLYQARQQRFVSRVMALKSRWTDTFKAARPWQVMTYHEGWNYLLEEYGFKHMGSFEPKPGMPILPSQLSSLLSTLSTGKVDVILISSYFNTDYISHLSRSSGVPFVTLSTMPRKSESVIDYFDRTYRSIFVGMTQGTVAKRLF